MGLSSSITDEVNLGAHPVGRAKIWVISNVLLVVNSVKCMAFRHRDSREVGSSKR
jgi:hypothetical protein